MARIYDFPDFEHEAVLDAADLNIAALQFCAVLGGVLPNAGPSGMLPGNVGSDNLVVSGAGFVPEQMVEPYSEFGVQFGRPDASVVSISGDAPAQLGPFPMDVWLTRISYRAAAGRKGSVSVKLGGVGLLSLTLESTFTDKEWPVEYEIPAGAVMEADVTYDPASSAAYFLMFTLKARHLGDAP